MSTYPLTPDEYHATREKIAKINSRAAKRGFTGRIEIAGVYTERTVTNEAGVELTETIVETEISGEAPSYGGWSFLAAVDSLPTEDGEGTFVLRYAPGVEEGSVDRSILAAGKCDHCRRTKINRVHTYLVKNDETGETKQVGSTCISDFLGWSGKPVFISVDEITESISGGGSYVREYAPATIIAIAHAAIHAYGWVPASHDYDGRPTKVVVGNYLHGTSRADKEIRAELSPRIAESQAKVAEIVATLAAEMDDSDYGANLKAALKASRVGHKQFGLLCSAPAAYDRIQGKKVEAAAREAAKAERPQAHIGQLKQRRHFTGIARMVRYCDTYYGVSTLLVLDTPEGTVKWFASGEHDIEIGDQVCLTATIKAHEEYQGELQTVVTRGKVTGVTRDGQEIAA